jgi:SnoaL-like polyketide cyclase
MLSGGSVRPQQLELRGVVVALLAGGPQLLELTGVVAVGAERRGDSPKTAHRSSVALGRAQRLRHNRGADRQCHAGPMDPILERALALWREPIPDGDAALEQFRTVYADTVVVNGVPSTVASLVDRARTMQRAFADVTYKVHDVVHGDQFLAFAFEIRGRHVGPWPSALGVLEPNGRDFVIPGMDIFRLDDFGRVAQLWATNDQSDVIAAALHSERG